MNIHHSCDWHYPAFCSSEDAQFISRKSCWDNLKVFCDLLKETRISLEFKNKSLTCTRIKAIQSCSTLWPKALFSFLPAGADDTRKIQNKKFVHNLPATRFHWKHFYLTEDVACREVRSSKGFDISPANCFGLYHWIPVLVLNEAAYKFTGVVHVPLRATVPGSSNH